MRVLAVGDVHGCTRALDALLGAVELGHTSQKDGRPLNLGHAVCIDTYAHGGGWLTCLDVHAGRLWMANEDGEVRTGWIDEY